MVRLKRFVPDQLLVVPPLKHRLNPVIIALARDIPAYAKRKLHEELTRLLPGVFITLDFTHGHGVDTAAMQSVLDAQRSVVMSVEPGLTRDTRSSFLKKLDVSVKSLFPFPSVVLVLASEDNRMGSEGNHTFGVHSYDLQAMADGDIKIALEGMAHAVHQIKSRPEIQVRGGAIPTHGSMHLPMHFFNTSLSTTFQCIHSTFSFPTFSTLSSSSIPHHRLLSTPPFHRTK